MAPTWIRGTLVCAYQFSITVGLLSASVINIITANIEGSAAYRIPLGLQFVPALILTGGIIILPETPRFLVMKGLPDQAGLSLSRLRRLDITHPALVDELQEIIANHQYELTLGPSSYRDLFRGSPHLARRTFTGCAVQILQQLTGINFILYYSTTFFGAVGVESPYTKSLIVNAINVVSTIPGLIIIESWGRRKLLMVGASGMAICQLVMATFAAAAGTDMQETAQLILIIFCNINVFFFAASWGPVAWVVTSEIYPLKVRAKAMSLSTMSNWLLNFSIAYASPFMVGKGPGHGDFGSKIFFIWGAFCLIAVFCVWGLVYETSRLSLEQIDEMYERVPRAWDSKNFEPSWSFQQILNEGWAASANPPPPGSHGSNGGPPPSPGAEAQELQSTMSISQASADTTLGDSASSETAHNNDGSQGGNPRPPSNEENKNQPVMAHVDFTY